MNARLAKTVAEAMLGGPDYARRLIKTSIARWQQIIQDASRRTGLPVEDGFVPDGFSIHQIRRLSHSAHIKKLLGEETPNDLSVWLVFFAGKAPELSGDQAYFGVVLCLGGKHAAFTSHETVGPGQIGFRAYGKKARQHDEEKFKDRFELYLSLFEQNTAAGVAYKIMEKRPPGTYSSVFYTLAK